MKMFKLGLDSKVESKSFRIIKEMSIGASVRHNKPPFSSTPCCPSKRKLEFTNHIGNSLFASPDFQSPATGLLRVGESRSSINNLTFEHRQYF